MILTDEIVKDFLQYLYDEGYRYLFMALPNTTVAVSKSKPLFSKDKCIESMMLYDVISGYSHKIGKIILGESGQCIDIGKQLNIIDHSAVKVDTKILVVYGENVILRVMKTEKYMLLIAEKLHGVPMLII